MIDERQYPYASARSGVPPSVVPFAATVPPIDVVRAARFPSGSYPIPSDTGTVSPAKVSASPVSYTYWAATNQRASRTVTAGTGTTTTEYYVYGPAGNLLEVLNGSGQVAERDMTGPNLGQVLATETVTTAGSAGTRHWLMTNQAGSVTDVVGDAGQVQDHLVYTSYGVVAAETHPGNGTRFGFAGMQSDPATGLNYDNARWYDPQQGRFVTRDPLGFGGGDADEYRYVGGNPTQWTDPTGLWATDGDLGTGTGRRAPGTNAWGDDLRPPTLPYDDGSAGGLERTGGFSVVPSDVFGQPDLTWRSAAELAAGLRELARRRQFYDDRLAGRNCHHSANPAADQAKLNYYRSQHDRWAAELASLAGDPMSAWGYAGAFAGSLGEQGEDALFHVTNGVADAITDPIGAAKAVAAAAAAEYEATVEQTSNYLARQFEADPTLSDTEAFAGGLAYLVTGAVGARQVLESGYNLDLESSEKLDPTGRWNGARTGRLLNGVSQLGQTAAVAIGGLAVEAETSEAAEAAQVAGRDAKCPKICFVAGTRVLMSPPSAPPAARATVEGAPPDDWRRVLDQLAVGLLAAAPVAYVLVARWESRRLQVAAAAELEGTEPVERPLRHPGRSGGRLRPTVLDDEVPGLVVLFGDTPFIVT